jgi:hypothetical protein
MQRTAIREVPRVAAGFRAAAPPSRPTGLWRYVLSGTPATLLTAPCVYSLLVPFLLLDVWVTAYQHVCFRAWGIGRVPRRTFFVVDRHQLPYLNAIERLNCTFCSYANGVLAYVREVAACTEQYWCPIKHAHRPEGPHRRYHEFFDFGDDVAYRTQLSAARRQLVDRRRQHPNRSHS